MAKCNFCGGKAKFDGKTVIGPWAYMCTSCIPDNGYPNNSDLTKVLREEKIPVGHELSYEAWYARVDTLVSEESGCSISDLPDYCTRDAYDDGLDPEQVAEDILMEADFY